MSLGPKVEWQFTNFGELYKWICDSTSSTSGRGITFLSDKFLGFLSFSLELYYLFIFS